MEKKPIAKNTVTIMGIDFINLKKEAFLESCVLPRLKNEGKTFIITANPEMVMRSKEDREFGEIMQTADFVVPDGAGVVMASKIVKDPIVERIPGFDLMVDLLGIAEEEGFSCYFLGARDFVNEKLVRVVKERYPKLNIAGHHHGFFPLDNAELAEDIAKRNPDIIFVALGSPRQEKWIAKYIDRFSKGLFMGVGGSFDVLSGEVKRAPEIWIQYNLEWLYRLLKQPFRIRRFLKSIKFMVRMIIFRR